MGSDSRRCRGFPDGGIKPHDAPAASFGARPTQCRDCHRAYLEAWRERKRKAPANGRFSKLHVADADPEPVSKEDLDGPSHEYVPDAGLLELWHSVVTGVKRGRLPANLLFLGPSGSGKTDGAQYLAGLVGLPYTKVDAASMTDPESWFGTREVIEESGASVTVYRPSGFVTAMSQPGVVLIDEATRIRDEHRNVILPLLDGTRRVTNPLTGDVLQRDARCFVILSGNRGLAYTGTYAVDPALLTRTLVYEFDYVRQDAEIKVAVQATGVSERDARTVVRFATETRAKATTDPDIHPMSTRQVITACERIADGLSVDAAVRYATINLAPGDGGAGSPRATLEVIWTGVRGR